MADPTLEEVRAALTYDPATGELRWTPKERKRRKSDVAGTINNAGYVVVRLLGKVRFGHRLAYLLHYGRWPDEIDHINGVRADNRIANLRSVPRSANARNHPARRVLVGAAPTEGGKWRAAVYQYGGAEDLGREFDTAEEANAAWLKAKKHVHKPDGRRPQLRIP